MMVYELNTLDLRSLGQDRAVTFFRKLLWAEASRVGIGRNLIDIPGCINVPDGGLDAIIQDAHPAVDEVIPEGLSGFQIKSSDLSPGECQKELHEQKDLSKPLKPEIKRLLDNNGTYVLVLFADITSQKKESREKAIKEELQKMGYANPKVRVYTINQIIGFAERFPALVAWLKEYPIYGLPYEIWAQNLDVSKPKFFVVDDERRKIINDVRGKLRDAENSTPIIRIEGLSGIGKTRLVFEALSPDDIKSKVIYFGNAEIFKNSPLFNVLLIDENLEAIVVVDECSLKDHEYFKNYFANRGQRLTIITLSHEMSTPSSPTYYWKLSPLLKEKIKELLSKEVQGLPPEAIDRLSVFADGYPRIAVLLAENYLADPESFSGDILTISDENLMNRLIAGTTDIRSDYFEKKIKKTLMWISLFEKIGYKGELKEETKWLARQIGIDWYEFQEIVAEQRKRGIIQGEYYIYVTPFALAIYLIREWWKIYGDNLEFEKFVKSFPEKCRYDMLDRLISRFPYITSIEQGKELVKKLLSKEGIFEDGSLLKTEIGGKFFLKLTEADPKSALLCLKRTIGTWDKEELLNFTTGRRYVVWALEKIAVWRELFPDAARVLLALGETENESYANNASGVFASLFSPAPAPVAPTEASPEERFPILIEAINSDSIERKKLALKAFKTALQWGHFSRVVGEHQGSKPLPKLWRPKTYKEIFDHYRRVWLYLEQNIEQFEEEIKKEAVNILLDSARGVAGIHPSLSEMVRNTIKKLASLSWVDKEKLIEVVSSIVHYDSDKMDKSSRNEWVELKEELTGSEFSDLLKRFVGMDLLEDYFQEGDKYDTKWIESNIKKLAERVINNPDMLDPEYSWLLTNKAKRGYLFGYHLGKLDSNFLFLNKLLKKYKKVGENISVYFLGGYFKAIFERDIAFWENTLEHLSRDSFFKKFIPELTWRSGMTDKAAKRILKLAKNGDIDISSFSIFKFGGLIKSISEYIFIEWIEYLLKNENHIGGIIALNLFSFYYVHREKEKTLPKELTFNLLLHPIFWNNPQNVLRDQMVNYYWKEVAIRLIEQFPETAELLAEQIIKYFGDDRSIAGGFYSQVYEVLEEIAKRKPSKTWEVVTKYLGPPIDIRAFRLKEWLRGEKGLVGRKGALELFNPEDIWKWVEEDIDNRAWYLATFVPPFLFHSEEKICLARELLVRYGDREDVRRNFSANYSTEGWTGPASKHYTNKKMELLKFKEKETNENVFKWIEEYIKILDKDIEKAKIEEERRGF
jgi:hypothetical protein